jgi:histidinol-phosphate/aromatic aminotransferase/cobyric acid decarboxylase-like protein
VSAVPPPGPHGGDVDAVAEWLGVDPGEVLDLSASLNPEAPDLAPAVTAARARLRHYPDAAAPTRDLAAAMEVDPDRLVLTNGGAEGIALVAAHQPHGWVEAPDFSLYERHLTELRPDGPRWRSNPSNPLGILARADERAAVWDEAFYPLATGSWTRGDEEAWRIGSLTKLWACPGVRLGYVVAPTADAADAIRHRQPRWAVNALALAVVDQLLPLTDLPAWSAAVARRRAALVDALARRHLEVTDTSANWVLVRRPGLRAALAAHGVLVRDCSSFGMPDTARVAVPDEAGLHRLLGALDATSG